MLNYWHNLPCKWRSSRASFAADKAVKCQQNRATGRAGWALSRKRAEARGETRFERICLAFGLTSCEFFFVLLISWKVHKMRIATTTAPPAPPPTTTLRGTKKKTTKTHELDEEATAARQEGPKINNIFFFVKQIRSLYRILQLLYYGWHKWWFYCLYLFYFTPIYQAHTWIALAQKERYKRIWRVLYRFLDIRVGKKAAAAQESHPFFFSQSLFHLVFTLFWSTLAIFVLVSTLFKF